MEPKFFLHDFDVDVFKGGRELVTYFVPAAALVGAGGYREVEEMRESCVCMCVCVCV